MLFISFINYLLIRFKFFHPLKNKQEMFSIYLNDSVLTGCTKYNCKTARYITFSDY